MFASALIALAFAYVARAQGSVVSVFPVGFEDDGLQGGPVGTGADGTTYAFDATFPTLSIPFTLTLVEDATHVSETAVIATAGETLFVGVECGFSSGIAVCTEIASEDSTSTVFVETGLVSLIGVPVVTGSVINSSASPSISFSSSQPTDTSSSDTASVLPASIPVSTPSATVTTPAATVVTPPAGTATGLSSGASRSALAGIGVTIPALMALLVAF
ncbi:hypothetical protein M0805_001367 [Coniferiporia weirii]|nr:hypothetical protein M0805_001367 [Coniferiporia weirii]